MGAVAPAIASPETRPERAPTVALQRLLDDLMHLLVGVPEHVYTAKVVRSSGSVGGHVRHVLDHVATLVAAASPMPVSYDHRVRGTAVEADTRAAIAEILRLNMALERWAVRSLDEPIPVRSMISADGQTVSGWSSMGRELAFVVNHTIHHQAMIALLLEVQGYRLANDDFGYAPSTVRSDT